jgi:glycosyltransferase involved in cell wall biosynthesis
MSEKSYVLVTAARNEEAYIDRVIKSVLAQTLLPSKWVIVSDGSTDQTEEIVREYLKHRTSIQLIRKEAGSNKENFASKVHAISMGYGLLKGLDYSFIGHLDADVSFDEQYYENVLKKFQENPKLGIAGGFIHECYKGHFKSRPFNNVNSVAGSIQLFRRECYETIGGLIPLETGGEDWCAEVMTRMKGWEVEAFPELRVFHHKHSSAVGRDFVRESLRQGRMDYLLGSHPIFETIKCFRRVKQKPYMIAALLRMVSFTFSYLSKEKKPVSDEFVNYLRSEQIQRVKSQIFFPTKNDKADLDKIYH